MIKFNNSIILIFILLIFTNCARKNKVETELVIDREISLEATKVVFDSTGANQSEFFFKLEKTMDNIKQEVEVLRNKVMEYEYMPPELDYTKQLKALIDNPPATHKILLKNGSTIKGTIEKDKLDFILVNTDLGKLTLNKSEIIDIKDLVLPSPKLVFIGHGNEEVFESYRFFYGKIMNQGNRRGDFVRVIYNLWGENTQLISSDSTFIDGTQIIYKSGIVTDTILEPNQSAQFKVKVLVPDSISVSYVTRDIHWEMFD